MKKYKIVIILLLICSSLLFAEEWHVNKSENNLVKFISSTPVLDFEGTTNIIDGYIYWEGEELFSINNELYFEVDLNSLETGIGKRDSDMREDVLETDKWPKTSFKGKIISVDSLKGKSNEFNVTSSGKMFIHGHEKVMEIKAKINIDDNLMTVTSKFSVFLKDYDIEAPSLIAFIKVAEEIKLELNFQLEKYLETK